MKINSSNATGKSFSISMPSGTPPLRLGQQIPGKVLGFSEGKPIVLLGEKPVMAESRVPLRIGEKLTLQVEGVTNGKMHLRIVDTSEGARANTDELARSLGLEPSPLTRAILSSLLDGEGETPSPRILEQACNMLKALQNQSKGAFEPTALTARTALAFAKLNIAESQATQNILMAAQHPDSMQNMLAKLAGHPAFRKYIGALPDSMSADFTTALKNSILRSGVSMEKNLMHSDANDASDSKALQDMKASALQSGTSAGARLADRLSAMQLSSAVAETIRIPVPFSHNGKPLVAEMTTRQSRHHHQGTPKTAVLDLDMPQTGRIRSMALIMDRKISIRIEMEKKQAVPLLRSLMPELRRRLTVSGFEVSGVSVHHNRSVNEKTYPVPGRIDVRA